MVVLDTELMIRVWLVAFLLCVVVSLVDRRAFDSVCDSLMQMSRLRRESRNLNSWWKLLGGGREACGRIGDLCSLWKNLVDDSEIPLRQLCELKST